MKILITGANGFIGKNLYASLRNLQLGYDRTRKGLQIDEIFTCDKETDPAVLEAYCGEADFVFHLAGVNRPVHPEEFMEGNYDFSSDLLYMLKRQKNTCPVMLSSSIQASLQGRFAGSAYGQSKLACEELFFLYAQETGAPVFVYRFENVFGKWSRPNYNSAVATFCYNRARDLPIRVDDRSTELELIYIDDLVAELLDALEGRAHMREEAGKTYCYVPTLHRQRLGDIVDLLEQFREQPRTLQMPSIPQDSFAKKLYSTYLSYLPAEKISFPLQMHTDERGSFTEILRTVDAGQFSVNVSGPGITKGEHWHHSKWEFFIVVAGRALIRQRRIDTDEVLEFEVSGEQLTAVHMLPGYTHNIINVSQTENLVTLMWANESFDPGHPDTFHENVIV
ncbi:MAG: NAD-dependent epimerase/dehydratase family protein [Eubacteriales bacterium]|nr:NAD-dependent epimerase/dehydratase family protein [Eubacteriales bacterium]